jgi:hypothetical protein
MRQVEESERKMLSLSLGSVLVVFDDNIVVVVVAVAVSSFEPHQ